MISLFLTGLLIFGACEKLEEPELSNEQSLEALENDAELKAAGIGFAIVVEPEGPEYDTDNLLNAFQEVADRQEPGLIQLTEGTYYLDFMYVEDFDGWLRGAGKDQTIIHPVPEGVELPDVLPMLIPAPCYLNFAGGDFRISDMTIDINLDEPMQPWDFFGVEETWMAGVIRITGSTAENYTANTWLNDLAVKGRYVELSSFTPYNVDNAIIFGGGVGMLPMGGTHRVQSCDFQLVETGINSLGASHSELVFGGSPPHGNTMQSMNCGILALHSEASDFRIAFNRMEDMLTFGGIYIEQDNVSWGNLNPGGSTYLLQKNSIDLGAASYPNAITFADYLALSDPEKASEFKLIGNQVSVSEPGQWGILAFWGVQDGEIIRNQVSGESEAGIVLWGYVHGFEVVNNSFGNFSSLVCDVFLHDYSYENLIVATDYTTVYDFGTDNVLKGDVELLNAALKSAGKVLNEEKTSKYKYPRPE